MKQVTHLILAATLIAASQLSCTRDIYREGSQADSTISRSAEASESYDRETVREYYGGPHDTIHTSSIRQIQVPVYIEKIRERGQKQERSQENKEVETSQQVTQKAARPWWHIALASGGAVFVAMVLLITLYKIVKSRFLAAAAGLISKS